MKRDIKKWWKGLVDILMTDHTKAISTVVAAATGALSAAERSYPTSKVRGSGLEFQAVMAQKQRRRTTQVRGQGRRPGGATPRQRSGAVTERRYPRMRPGAAASRTNPTSKKQWLHGCRRV